VCVCACAWAWAWAWAPDCSLVVGVRLTAWCWCGSVCGCASGGTFAVMQHGPAGAWACGWANLGGPCQKLLQRCASVGIGLRVCKCGHLCFGAACVCAGVGMGPRVCRCGHLCFRAGWACGCAIVWAWACGCVGVGMGLRTLVLISLQNFPLVLIFIWPMLLRAPPARKFDSDFDRVLPDCPDIGYTGSPSHALAYVSTSRHAHVGKYGPSGLLHVSLASISVCVE
jgi:hypothetical protein